MHLLTVSGFLGSGKTTLIIKLAAEAVKKGLKPAVLVNEIGALGVDDQFMKRLDIDIYQLVGGCICCSLASNLAQALQRLVEDYSPDLVVIEPSGAAELNKVIEALKFYTGAPFETKRSLVLLDALRLHILIQALTPLITAQIKSADIILLNKVDTAKPEEVQKSRSIISGLQPEKPLYEVSAKIGLSAKLVEVLLP